MADIGDVANALVNMASAALYPNGVQAGSPVGVNFRIYRGHPGPDVLDSDIQAGFTNGAGGWSMTNAASRIVHVCVNARAGVGRLVEPYVFSGVQVAAAPPVTVTAAVFGQTITLGGVVSQGQGVAAVCGLALAGVAAGSTDTLASLATNLAAALSAAGAPSMASGAVVAVGGTTPPLANTFVQVSTGREVERQIQGFEITIYAPGRDLRDATSAVLKPALAAIQRFTLPDGFQALARSAPPIELDDDRPERALLFIRKLYVNVEYATVVAGVTSTLSIAQEIFKDPLGNTRAVKVEA